MLAGQRPDVCNMQTEQRDRPRLISLSEQHARACVCVLLATKIFILLKKRTTLKSGLGSGLASGG